MSTTGQSLIALLEARGVEVVFGIPGVHTIELYRGLAGSAIRHVTPRHEQGAAFMADGYARVSGKPGVVFVITGPGLTNTLTAMAQARAESVPMLVVSSVNRRETLGKGFGYLHELPDQQGLIATLALQSERVEAPQELPAAVDRAFRRLTDGRSGPVHIEIPLDVLSQAAGAEEALPSRPAPAAPDEDAIAAAAALAAAAERPLILAGGGARHAQSPLRSLAERLSAPVVTTCNGRGLLHRHPLAVPASPSLKAVRTLMAAADLVIAAGTELGPTDYDMYADGGFVLPEQLVRIDIDPAQLARLPARVGIAADAQAGLDRLLGALPRALATDGSGAARAEAARAAAWAEIGPDMQNQVRAVEVIRDTLPGAIIVGDFDPAGLRSQSVLRSRPPWRLVQCGDRLWRARLRASGGDRRCAGRPAGAGGLPGRRRRLPVQLCGVGDRGRGRRGGDLPRLEQSRLPRDRGLDAGCRRRAGRRLAGAARFLPHRRRLPHAGRAAGGAERPSRGAGTGLHVAQAVPDRDHCGLRVAPWL